MGIRNTWRKLPRASGLCLGGLIGTSVIAGALITGDSLDNMVTEQSVAALGEIDMVVTSPRFFDHSVYSTLKKDGNITALTDGIAPLITSPGTVRYGQTGSVEGGVNVYGIDNSFYEFGSFYNSGRKIPNLYQGDCVINTVLADNLGVGTGDRITLQLRDPDPSDTLFLNSGETTFSVNLTVAEIYENRGLGSINLNSRNTNVNNLFLPMTELQETLGESGGINTVIISNSGDELAGTAKDGKVVEALHAVLDDLFGLTEVGYEVLTANDLIVLTHRDVLFEEKEDFQFHDSIPTSGLLTYFVNSMGHGNSSLSYSILTGINTLADAAFGDFHSGGSILELKEIGEDEIVINNWTSDRLGAGPGDIVSINYTVLDNNYRRTDHEISLRVKAVVDITGKAADRWLMPDIPGIKEIDTCDEWAPPFDIDLSSIRDADREYWNLYGGVPKGYIDLDLAQRLFGNFQGDLTHLKIRPPGKNSTVLNELDGRQGAGDFGITIKTVKADHLATREGMWIFTGMFLAFGTMIIIAGALLIMNIFMGMVLNRKREIGILRSQGAGNLAVGMTFFTEGAVYSLISAALGVGFGIAVARSIVYGLNTVWARSIESNDLTLYFTGPTILVSFSLGLFVCLISIIIPVFFISRMNVADTIHMRQHVSQRKRKTKAGEISAFFGNRRRLLLNLTGVLMVLYVLFYSIFIMKGEGENLVTTFMINGSILVLGLFMLVVNNHIWLAGLLGRRGAVGRIAVSGVMRRRTRTFLAVLSLSFVVFIIVALSVIDSNQQRRLDDELDRQSGGYDIMAISTIPVTSDIASSDHGFMDEASVVQIRSVGEPGGTCSNMNARFPPQMIGVPQDFIEYNKVSFSSSIYEGKNDREIWRTLEKEATNDAYIPIVVDLNTLVWVYGGDLGDTFTVTGDLGNEHTLKVTGIMDNSIFAGMFIMSERNIEKVFPLTAKYTYFLFRSEATPGDLAMEIEKEMASYGMDASATRDVVRSNMEFEASYMRIFQFYLVLGLLVGSAGIGVIVYRSASERKFEMGILRSLGMANRQVALSFIYEASFISISGIVIGALAGLSSAYLSFSVWGGGGFGFPVMSVLVVPFFIYIVATVSSCIPAYIAARTAPAESLRDGG